MKKGNYFLILILFIVMLPTFVFAGEIHFNDPVKKEGNVYTFTLTIKDGNLNYITGDLETPNATITNITMSNGWINKTGLKNHFYFYHNGKSSGSFTIATFEITIYDNSVYKATNVNYGFTTCQLDSYGNYFGENGTLVTKDEYDKTCGISKDATLKSLKISSGTLSPNFDPSLEIYSATVENNVSSVTFQATPKSSKATIISGVICSLKEGLNTCKVVVQAEAGNTKTYTITVTRKNKQNQTPMLSNDTTFYNFSVHGGKLTTTFQPNVKDYTIHVDKNASSVYFTFTMNSNHISYTSGKCSAYAEVCRLTVTAEDGVSKITYTFHLVNPNGSSNQQNVPQSSNDVSVNVNTSSSGSHTNTNSSSSTNKDNLITEEKIPMNAITIEEEGFPKEKNEEQKEEVEEEKIESEEEKKFQIPFLKNVSNHHFIQIGIVLLLFIGLGIGSYFIVKYNRKKKK